MLAEMPGKGHKPVLQDIMNEKLACEALSFVKSFAEGMKECTFHGGLRVAVYATEANVRVVTNMPQI